MAAALAFAVAQQRFARPPGAPGGAPEAAAARAHRTIAWADLVPTGWNAPAPVASASLTAWADDDPRARQLLDQLRSAWAAAPTVAALDGAAVRLSGYIVPLEGDARALREFLLVPYHGACIHTPPPPANQIVLVRTAQPLSGLRTMDIAQVRGVLRTERRDHNLGASGYAMDASMVMRLARP